MAKKNRRKPGRPPEIDPRKHAAAQLSPDAAPLPPVGYKSRSLPWILAALVAVNLVIYAQVRRHEFTQWDDPYYVSQNLEVSRGLTWQGVRWAFTAVHEANWHPLTWLSHMLDVQLFGMSPGPHHLVNVFIHILNTLLLFWALFRMTAAMGRSAFVAGLFAAHPLHVESVAWVAERKDVLSAFFMLLAICAYIFYVQKTGARRYLWVAAFFALALMSKPMAITLPFILMLLDVWPLRRLHPVPGQKGAILRLVREKAPLVLLATASGIVTIWAQWHGGSVVKMDVYPLSSRAANALASYAAYLGDMLWPAGLSAFYPYGAIPALWVLACFLALAGATFLAVRFASRHPFLLTGWIWYLATLAPVIGLIQVGAQARADRYTYVPLIGTFIIIAWSVPEILRRLRIPRIALAAAACGVICALAIVSRAQAGHWINGVALWEHALKSYPDSYFIHSNAGYEYSARGETDNAMRRYSESLRLNPNYAQAHNGLGVELIKKGRTQEALERFTSALRHKPDYAEAHCNLGARLAALGKTDEAISHFRTALKINPRDPQIHYDMGVALTKLGESEQAIAHLAEALRLNPGFAEACNWLGNALAKQGKLDEAVARYKEALRIRPGLAEAHNNLGIALANQGDLDEAVAQYRQALRFKPDLAEAYNGLANVLSNQNKPDEAIAQYNEALRVAPDFAEARRNLGVVLARQGKMDEAFHQFREALRIKPDLAESYGGMGDAFLSQGKINEALAQYKEAVRIKPSYVDARYSLGIACMLRGMYDEAIVQFTEVLRAAPDNIGARGNLGMALINIGREEEAISHLMEVLRVRPDDKAMNNSLRIAQTNLKKKGKRSASD